MLGRRKSSVRRPGKAKRIAITFLVFAVLGGAAYAVWFSPMLEIQAVHVEGARSTDAGKFEEGVGKNILFWDVPTGSDELPYVANIEVRKDYAERTISVKLTERDRDIIWCLEKSGECFWADENGLIFSNAPNPSGPLVIKVVRDHTERGLTLGDRVLEEEMFLNLEKIFVLLDNTGLSIVEMRIDDLKFKEITATVASGPELYFSLLLDPEFGRSVIGSLRESSEWGRIRYVDLRVENRAYYSL